MCVCLDVFWRIYIHMPQVDTRLGARRSGQWKCNCFDFAGGTDWKREWLVVGAFSRTVCLSALQWPSLSQQTYFYKPATFSVLTWLQGNIDYNVSLVAAAAEEVSQIGSQTVGLDRQANELPNT